jgi:hypothetical protein
MYETLKLLETFSDERSAVEPNIFTSIPAPQIRIVASPPDSFIRDLESYLFLL